MITDKQCARLRRDHSRTHNMKLSALNVDADAECTENQRFEMHMGREV
jgi:hypothetical protein